MAYAALLSLAQTLKNIILSGDESLFLDDKLQMKYLHRKLGFFISFLDETSQKNSDLMEDLEEIIRDVVYEAEDIIESHMSNKILSRSEENYEEDIQNVIEKLDSIWEEVEKMKNENKIEALPIKVENSSKIEEVEQMQQVDSSLLKSASSNTSATIVGFEADMHQIKDLLVGSSTKLEAISIVGMGGIGKTTLARNIYNDSFVNRHFDIRAWTTVSQNYNVGTLLVDLLRSTGELTDKMNGADNEELKLQLYQSLKQRRYLIIMDDVWDTDFLKEFKMIFPDDNRGSRIIMTTRSSKVANVEYYSNHMHHMNFLNPDQSWNLLLHKALGRVSCPPRLEEIGRKIAEKCKGHPLALVVVGGVLNKGKRTRAHWKYVEKNMKSTEAGNYDDLIEVLSWSYNHLPNHLKACFLYMAVYPEDYVIHISHILRLWLAEGFIKPIPPKIFEDVAKEYLEDLIARNLIMVRDRNYYGEIKTCIIHDLLRKLCMEKAREEMFLHVVDNDDEEAIENQRFLSFHRKDLFDHRYHRSIRSLVCFIRSVYVLPKSIPLQLLRVLDACNIRFDNFPTQVLKLVNLRYLAFSYNGQGKIPASISRLCFLQTLIVMRRYWKSGFSTLYLPPNISNMPCLRHLLVDGSNFLSYDFGAPNGNIQVLSGVVDFRFMEETIQKFLDLKTLGIVYRFDQKIEWSFYHLENLVHLHQLENLKLHFSGGDEWCQLPLNLSFPHKLNKLTLNGCMISWKHTSIIGSLPNLQVLKFKNVAFKNGVWETNAGDFSKLKYLHVGSVDLEHWEVEESHFPVLECLSLKYCLNLECIPSGIGEIQSLQNIILDECSSDVVDSANEILNEQHDFGNETLQLHVYPDKNGRGRSGICFHERYWNYW